MRVTRNTIAYILGKLLGKPLGKPENRQENNAGWVSEK
jgi:hypothetical protein